MANPNRMRLTHLGIYVQNMDKMIDFYTREFGFRVTDRGVGTSGIEGVFLSADPMEHHQLVFVTGRDPTSKPTTNQISFLMESLEALRAYAAHCKEAGVPVVMVKDHGNAWSIYVKDPEDNMIEVYCHSPWYVRQPVGKPLDLSEPADVIRTKTEAMVRTQPGFQTREAWMAEFAATFQE
ncbi:VOC family protein [Cupriavidus basilensis]|uniref:VOC family protein n=1 Tax=Cupriavidus basilensis TaxID=68895 RepID=UPI00157AFDE0|nr:VOC family protein [Cupriavidus basilensis]NUA26932.1 VOC family protein [Cupriavidus basilensis]